MTPPPESSDIAAPKNPADYRPRPLLGVGFWALIAFAVLCVLAGVTVANYGPRLWPGNATPAPVAQPAPAPVVARPAAVATPSVASDLPTSAGPEDLERLDARVAILESQEARTSQAAASALAAAAVVEASQGSGPFAEQMAGLTALAPPSQELVALGRLAQIGAPSRAALAASFPEYAARAASAAHRPGEGAGLGDQIVYALSRVVTLRRVGDVPGSGVDALLARAERQVEDGDLDRAMLTLDGLPARANEAMAPWRGRAERRAEIDRNAAALRARALQALSVRSGP